MSYRNTSVLANYNPLTDPHLAAHYSSTRKRKDLKSAGLIKRNGEIVSDRQWLTYNQTKETKSHMKDLLTQAVVHKAIEFERTRQVSIRDQLELMAKKERVRRIRAERSKSDLNINYSSASAPRSKAQKDKDDQEKEVTEKDAKKTKAKEPEKKSLASINQLATKKVKEMDNYTIKMLKREVDRQRAFGPGPSPFNVSKADVDLVTPSPRLQKAVTPPPESQEMQKTKMKSSGTRLHRPEPGMIIKVRQQSLCEMKFKFIGRPGIGETAYLDPEDVVIEQQHCGGETIKVYHGLLQKGEKLTFVSRRHRGYPFSFVMYVNNIRVERISACCEYRFKKGSKLGTGSIKFLGVKGAAPCFRCNVRKGMVKDKPDPAPRPKSRLDSIDRSDGGKSAPRSHSQKKQDEQPIVNHDSDSSSSSSSDSESDRENEVKENDADNTDNFVDENFEDESSKIEEYSKTEKSNVEEPEVETVSSTETVSSESKKTEEKTENDIIEKEDDTSSIKSSSASSSSDDSDVQSVVSEPDTSVLENSQIEVSQFETSEKIESLSVTQPVSAITEPTTSVTTSPSTVTEPSSVALDQAPTIVEPSAPSVHTPSPPPPQDTRPSPGLSSAMANELVGNALLSVAEPQLESESLTASSPTSPFANEMVDQLLENIQSGNDTNRSEDTFTEVTKSFSDDNATDRSYNSSSSSSDSESDSEKSNLSKSKTK